MCINLCSVEITQAPMNFNAPSKATRLVDHISPHGIACLLHSPHLNLWALVANISHIGQVRIAPFSDDDTSFSYPPRLLESRRDAAVPKKQSTLEEFRAVFSLVLSSKWCKQKLQKPGCTRIKTLGNCWKSLPKPKDFGAFRVLGLPNHQM